VTYVFAETQNQGEIDMAVKLPEPIQKPVAVELRVFGVTAVNIELLDKDGNRVGTASVHLKEEDVPDNIREELEKLVLAKQTKEKELAKIAVEQKRLDEEYKAKAKANQNKKKEK